MLILLLIWGWINVGAMSGILKHDVTTDPLSLYGLKIILAGPFGFFMSLESP